MSDTSVTFENAALSEAVKRAARIAPTRGEAFDKAAGIVIEVTPGAEWPVIIKSTNLSLYYLEFVAVAMSAGDPVVWRVSSELFSQIITKLPIGTGKNVTIEQKENKLEIKSGRFKASIGLMRGQFYPEWGLFDVESTAPVSSLGPRLNQVSWAATKGIGIESTDGVRFNGQNIFATDRYRLAVASMGAPHLSSGVTISASLLSGILPEGGQTRVGLVEDQMLILPTNYIQIRATAFASDFPPVEKIMRRDYPNKITFSKQEAIDAISRVSAADAKNRMPEITMFIGKGELVFFMQDSAGIDKIMDHVDIGGQAEHERHKIYVTPNALIDSMNASQGGMVTLHYDVSNHTRLLYLDCGNGYECWIVPRTGQRAETTTEGGNE